MSEHKFAKNTHVERRASLTDHYVVDDEGEVVGTAWGRNSEANASVWAAAPDMVEALETGLMHMTGPGLLRYVAKRLAVISSDRTREQVKEALFVKAALEEGALGKARGENARDGTSR